MKKLGILFVMVVGVLVVILWAFFHFSKKRQDINLVVIPHFMIDSGKVSEFYELTKQEYFGENTLPDRIILISPNHFFSRQMKIEGLCKIEDIKFGNYTVRALPSNIDDIECSGGVFYFIGSQKFVKDHGLGEHFKWLNKYYSGLDVIPLALPTRQMNVSNKVFQRIKTLSGKTLIIASVDFSHYKSESIAKRNDEISYFTLNSTGTLFDISKLDVDCPSCLGVIYLLAKENNKRIQQWYRDSSSTIVGYDLKEKNTSRLFLWWSK